MGIMRRMRPRTRTRELGPATKLGIYAAVLAAALGGGAAVGAAIGPDGADTVTSSDDHGGRDEAGGIEGAGAGEATTAPGTSVSTDGYTLDLRTRSVLAGRRSEVELAIVGDDGRAVVDYEVEHDKELHLVVVGRDLAGYAHVHPARDEAGLWSVQLPELAAGSYRVFADFVPAGGVGVTLGSDLTVLGDVDDADLPAPSRAASIDGYDVVLDGELVAGRESIVAVTVSRDGGPVTDLDPYLGALGHLVAIRDGDLAYLHVHPLDALDGPGGPRVRFAVEVPTTGTYGLFFDFSHRHAVRTAPFLVTAESLTSEANAPQTDAPATTGAAHDGHGG